MKVNIKTFAGDYITFDEVNRVEDLLVKLKEYNDEYSMVCLYDILTEEKIDMNYEFKDGQDLFMVVSMIDVEMYAYFHNTFEKDDPEFYVNVEFEFVCNFLGGKEKDFNHSEDIFYYPKRGVIIESFICCLQCEYRDEYRDLESYLEKRLSKIYPSLQKKLAIYDASLLWNIRETHKVDKRNL